QTNASLIIPNASIGDSDCYLVTVTNDFGSVDSALAEVTVMSTQPPAITQQPVSTTRYRGATATLTVAATGGTHLQYQWLDINKNEPRIVGATNASLVLSNVQPIQASDYRVVVSNSVGSVTSDVASITVLMPVPGSYEVLIVADGPLAYWRFN